MNEKNFDYLKNQVKFTGFGEGLENDLKEKLTTGEQRFTLFHNATFGNDSTISTLQFKKSDESDMYFFNSYSMALKNAQNPDGIKQNFYINKEDNITLKEAYNLMSGRSVYKELANKEGEKYTAWLQMDFKETDKSGNYKVKQYHQNYGYDIEATLAKHPIKELGTEQDKIRLLESLQRGNRQSVTLVKEGNETKVFIEASPQFKSLNFYDANMQRIKAENLYEKKTNGQSVKNEVNESQKQDDKKQKIQAPKQVMKNGKKRKQEMKV
jgi:hypothetical protein